jgi:hypothetical protein
MFVLLPLLGSRGGVYCLDGGPHYVVSVWFVFCSCGGACL